MINATHVTSRQALLIILLTILSIAGLTAKVNNSAAAYIRMGIGARIIAMGEAGTAATDDITAAYWNPAGLNTLKDVEFASMYNLNMGYDRTYKYAAIGQNYGFGTLALNWINASVSDIDGYDENGNTTGFFNNNEHNIGLSYANKYKFLQYGATAKYYLSMMDGELKSGMGFDLGLKYDINQYMVTGFSMRDAYAKLGEDKIPYQLNAGLAAYPFLGITLATDLVWEQSETPTYGFGAEYVMSIGKDNEADSKLSVVNVKERGDWKDLVNNAEVAVRMGFNDGRFSAGTGIQLSNFQIDYVYRINNHDIFSDDHIISLILRF